MLKYIQNDFNNIKKYVYTLTSTIDNKRNAILITKYQRAATRVYFFVKI